VRRDLPSGPDLILVPTSLELRRLEGPDPFPEGSVLALCGFGPVSAAARTAQCLAELRPRRALLVGIAGSLDAKRAPLRSVNAFARVRLDGVGAGQGAAFQPPSRLGLPQWDGGPGAPVGETLELAGGGGELLTVCSASATPGEAALRRERHPEALAEDMEGFGVALACHLAGVPLTVVRGISNLAGQREKGGWCVDEALEAARLAALAWLAQVAGARGGHRA
jgi:futalosine hydrolase